MKLLGQLWAAFVSILLELFKGTEDLAKAYSEATGSIYDASKGLRVTEEQLAADNDIARIQRDITIVENLTKLKAKLGNDPAAIAAIDNKIAAIREANQPKAKP